MPSTALQAVQDEVNRAVYFAPGVGRHYRAKALTPQEVAFLDRYPQHTNGCVLDIGVGTGRTTRHLVSRARRYEAIDYSPVMIDHVRRACPEANSHQADWRDLSAFEDKSFDLVLGAGNVIDALAHHDRLRALAETSRVLRQGGLVAFSSHNINFRNAFSGPRLRWAIDPRMLAANVLQFLRRRRNHQRVGPLRQVNAQYALLNDESHDYACLHYYASRTTVRTQLASAGLRLRDVIDSRGRLVTDADSEEDTPNFLYVAEKLS